MENVRFTSFDGVEILLIELAGRAGPDSLSVFAHASEIIRSQPPGSVRTLIDISSLEDLQRFVTDRSMTASVQAMILANQPFVWARAIVVGNDETTRVIAGFLARSGEQPFEIFTKIKEAMAWLAAQ